MYFSKSCPNLSNARVYVAFDKTYISYTSIKLRNNCQNSHKTFQICAQQTRHFLCKLSMSADAASDKVY